ncbi:MAG: DUF4351 domain-containing protein [Cyanobacteria bacterium M_surface_10_m2_119]|nr:DUF4351 domain-containing protein [Cyanobacteria bacterium M_surface_10_m2_119]
MAGGSGLSGTFRGGGSHHQVRACRTGDASQPCPPKTCARIQAMPLDQLEALAEALLDFAGPADLAAWLDQHKA